MDKPIRPVAAATIGYLGIATIFAFRLQNRECVFYIVVVLVLGLAVAMWHSRTSHT